MLVEVDERRVVVVREGVRGGFWLGRGERRGGGRWEVVGFMEIVVWGVLMGEEVEVGVVDGVEFVGWVWVGGVVGVMWGG